MRVPLVCFWRHEMVPSREYFTGPTKFCFEPTFNWRGWWYSGTWYSSACYSSYRHVACSSCCYFCCFRWIHSSLAALPDNVPACVSALLLSSVPISTASVRTRSAAFALFLSSLQCFRDCAAHRNAEFTKLNEKYIQLEELVGSFDTRLKESEVRYGEDREGQDQLRITHADLFKELDTQREASELMCVSLSLNLRPILYTSLRLN